MAAVVEASKSQHPPSEERVVSFTIDLGECQRKTVEALIKARAAQRNAKTSSEPGSLLTRASLLFSKTGKPVNMGEVVDRSSSLITLRRTGFIPEDFIQSGVEMNFKRLVNAYDLKQLVQFGFTFDHFCQLGFDTDDLRNFSPEHYRFLGLTAPVILERVPLTGEDLIQLGLEPHFLREIRFTFSHFVHKLKMTREQLKQLMSERDMKMYFSPSQSELNALNQKSSVASKQSRFLQANTHTQSTKLTF